MIETAEALIEALRGHELLEPERLDREWPGDARSIAGELSSLGWLTPFQAEKVLGGEAGSLKLGEYTILDRIGGGGMGRVYRARHRLMGRVVAVKLLRLDRLDHPGAASRFRREIRAAAGLSHPNIVRAYDAAEAGGVDFLVMEYVEGIDLARLVRERGPLDPRVACDYARQAALGLAHAHRMGLVHRDVKPSNLLACEGGSVVKLLDLGLARIDAEAGAESLTLDGLVMGTPDYMPPEQASDPASADARSDLYALGCSLHHLLAGRPPFRSASAFETLLKHREIDPVPVEAIRPGLPRGLGRAVRALMAKSPADRPASADAVVDLLAPFCSENVSMRSISAPGNLLPSLAPEPGVPDPTGPARPRPRRALRAVGATLVGSFAIWAVARPSARGPVEAPRPSATPGTAIPGPPPGFEAAKRSAYDLFRSGDYEQSMAAFDEALRLEPGDLSLRIDRSRPLTFLGRHREALALVEPVVRDHPGDPTARQRRGECNEGCGNFDAALADYTAALRLDPRFAPAYYARGMLRARIGDHDGALSDFDVLLGRWKTVTHYTSRGRIFFAKGDGRRAAADFSEAIRLDPTDPGVYRLRARALLLAGDEAAARVDEREAEARERHPGR